MRQGQFQLRLPWWFWVGLLGFYIFGGWKGFIGAIAGVLFLPIILFLGLAVIVILWAVISGKRFTRFPPQDGTFRAYRGQQPGQAPRTQPSGDIIETEATVVRRDD